jgi:para-aminobenzoate N-oxygenase AurF
VTILTNNKDGQRFVSLLDRLGRMSVDDYYNPYRMFKWPEMLPKDQLWMSRDLLSVYGTPAMDRLSEEQIIRLGIWESVNFYSLNVHGIRELLTEVINRVHMPGFEVPSEFFHHFIGEENEHMWFFAEFCRRYGEKFYYFPRIKLTAPADDAIENLLVFARILMFEEIVDYYNQRMADDESLHETIRQINRIHHRDESRHIAFGRELVSLLWARLHERLDDAELASIREYLRDYFRFCLHSFYSLDAYDDAKIDDPIAFRQELITSPRRAQAHERVVRKPLSYLRKTGIFDEGTIL